MAGDMSLRGFAELDRQLERLTTAAGKGAMRRALKTAAQRIADGAAARADRVSGDLAESFAVSAKLSKRQAAMHRRFKSSTAVEMFIGAGPLPQAHLEEFGSVNQAPTPMLRPSWDAGRDEMLDRLGREMWVEVTKSIGRAERKAARAARG
ncbi:hypothetical protein AN189_18085 [Loktanella sp. 3ANDIMAR09]|uniref:HK97 gp10 family phage protein n=1 Tax=Loktanella sp. 3ANDIMAR09 TaxID=1225657 RepID=UPI0006F826B9|nr:HK97 gp10 family phage protein [Loktanella sp. 3ANDIMAR09]KQI66965.1 hypothetical protein AN189_18085 [Loktanella sp. 3ANDIMAR09]